MQIRKATFKQSASSIFGCPKPTLQEYAFIGRSNVGKSSLINMLCNNNKLAKTSATPGKTQLINHFIINDSWYLVDLPGYGFAKTSKTARAKFETIIFDYCKKRETLVCLFVLIDSRLPLQKIDLEFMLWCAESEIPFCIIYTKTDKNSKAELAKNIKNIEKELLKAWEELPNSFISSAEKGAGKEEILEFIDFQIHETDIRLKSQKENKQEEESIESEDSEDI
jgi:GTP-binding protein